MNSRNDIRWLVASKHMEVIEYLKFSLSKEEIDNILKKLDEDIHRYCIANKSGEFSGSFSEFLRRKMLLDSQNNILDNNNTIDIDHIMNSSANQGIVGQFANDLKTVKNTSVTSYEFKPGAKVSGEVENYDNMSVDDILRSNANRR